MIRHWRILQVEDQTEELTKFIKNIYFINNQSFLNEKAEILDGLSDLFKYENIKDSSFIRNQNVGDSFPLKVKNISEAMQCFKYLKEKNIPPDIILLDIQLTHKYEQESGEEIEFIKKMYEQNFEYMDSDVSDLIKNTFYLDTSKKIDLSDTSIMNRKEIPPLFRRAGMYLLPFIREYFPNAEIIVYTESGDLFQEVLPFQYLKILFIVPGGKFLTMGEDGDNRVNIYYIFNKMIVKYIQEDMVDGEKVKKLLNEYETNFNRIINQQNALYENQGLTLNQKKEITPLSVGLLMENIGKIQHGWTMGSFFILELLNFFSSDTKTVKKTLDKIKSLIDRIDYSKSFYQWILDSKNTNFHKLTHSQESNNNNINELFTQFKVQISNFSLRNNPLTRDLFEYIESIPSESADEEIKNKINSVRNLIRILPTELCKFCKELNSICIIEKPKYTDNKELVYPFLNVGNKKVNFILRVIQIIICEIETHAFPENKNNKIIIQILEGDDCLKVIIRDNGKGFAKEALSHPKYFSDNVENHGLRQIIKNSKGWLKINIEACDGQSEYERNPHTEFFSIKSRNEDPKSKLETGTTFTLVFTKHRLEN